jgi:hypothetical protein
MADRIFWGEAGIAGTVSVVMVFAFFREKLYCPGKAFFCLERIDNSPV